MADYNAEKYWVEGSDLLTDAEKVQMAKDLRELESRGVIEFRDGRWELAAGAHKAILKAADRTEKNNND
jgi:hypothetical protein